MSERKNHLGGYVKMKERKTSIRTKLICIAALFIMLIGSTMTVSAEEKGYDEGKGYRYMNSAGTFFYIPVAPGADENGLPVSYHKSDRVYCAVQDLTPNGVYLYWRKNADGGCNGYTAEQYALLKAAIDAAGITNEMSQYDKCVAINNYICSVFDYRMLSVYWVREGDAAGMLMAEMAAQQAWECTKIMLEQGHSNQDGLIALWCQAKGMQPEIVCGEYMDLYQTMCSILGIDCMCLVSDDHGWCTVIAEGKRYYVDPTFNDTSGTNNYLMSRTNWEDGEHNIVCVYYDWIDWVLWKEFGGIDFSQVLPDILVDEY